MQMKTLLHLQGKKRRVFQPTSTTLPSGQDADVEMEVEKADQIGNVMPPPDQPQKKTRQININFGMSDSDDDD